MGIADRRDASEAWLAEVAELQTKGVQSDDSLIRPWKGQRGDTSLLIRLSDLWDCYLKGTSEGGKCFHGLKAVKEVIETPAHPQYKALLERLDRLAQRMGRLISLEIPLVKLVGLDVKKQAPLANEIKADALPEDASNDPLILLFQRISTAGERLSFEDLLFSMIKRSWPQAHDLVEKIHQGKVKHLLTAPGYVMVAFRLASIDYRLKAESLEGSKFTDVPDPGDDTFYARLNILLGDSDNPGPLRTYVGMGDQVSPLANAFDRLYELIVFDATTNPNGIPELMMPLLPHHLIHVLVYWVLKQDTNASYVTLKQSSEKLIAFVLFWHLGCIDGARASREALAYLEASSEPQFPGVELYTKLVTPPENSDKRGAVRAIFSPKEISLILNIERKQELRSMNERRTAETTENDPRFELYYIFWGTHTTLLWLQRAYLGGAQFSAFMALAGKLDAETVPYDYDHICPKAEWREIRSASGELVVLWMRKLVGDSIGNLHLLDPAGNRGLGDASTSQKFDKLEFLSSDFFLNSAIDSKDRPLWETASPCSDVWEEKYKWNEARIGAFQEAVENRVMHLYSLYFDGMKCLLPTAQSSANTINTAEPLAERVSLDEPLLVIS
jgi:hypothetical protein